MSNSLLSLDSVNVYYDKMHILHDVNFDVGRSKPEFVALLGRNGVGKTTTLRAISGLTPPHSGTISFNDHDLQNLPAHTISKLGMSHVLQGLNVFPELTVQENLYFNLGRMHTDLELQLEQVFQYFPNLKARLRQQANVLSGGERQMLAIARAWLAQPRLILLDEPTAGLMPKLVWQVMETLLDMHQQGDVSVLLVEQEVELALKFSDRVYIMDKGQIVFEGISQEITLADVQPYLGV